jgi:hypothetical protein
MKKFEIKGIIEGLKEGLRIVILSVVSYLLTDGVIQTVIGWLWGGKMDATQITLVSGLVLSVLKSIDKWAYKTDRTIIPLEGSTGITGI